jgi:hypothetical protein
MADKWSKTPGEGDQATLDTVLTPCYQPKQQPSLADQLGEAGVARLVARYRTGTTQQELADCYGTSTSSVKRLIHAHGCAAVAPPPQPRELSSSV